LKSKISQQEDYFGKKIIDLDQFYEDYKNTYQFKFVNINDFSKNEMRIYSFKDQIISLLGKTPKNLSEILISDNIRNDKYSTYDTLGLFDGSRIIILRSQLKSLDSFSGTLLHELVHANSGYDDVSRDFEEALTKLLGKLAFNLLQNEMS